MQKGVNNFMKIYYYNVEKLSDKSVYSKYYEMMDEDRKNKIDRINQEDKKAKSCSWNSYTAYKKN